MNLKVKATIGHDRDGRPPYSRQVQGTGGPRLLEGGDAADMSRFHGSDPLLYNIIFETERAGLLVESLLS